MINEYSTAQEIFDFVINSFFNQNGYTGRFYDED